MDNDAQSLSIFGFHSNIRLELMNRINQYLNDLNKLLVEKQNELVLTGKK